VPDADDELAAGAVVPHVVVGLRHLLKAVINAVHGEGRPAVTASSISWKVSRGVGRAGMSVDSTNI
jgi:hypothetical protein